MLTAALTSGQPHPELTMPAVPAVSPEAALQDPDAVVQRILASSAALPGMCTAYAKLLRLLPNKAREDQVISWMRAHNRTCDCRTRIGRTPVPDAPDESWIFEDSGKEGEE